MDVSTMSGLELLRAMADGSVPGASIVQTVPMFDIKVDHGRVRLSARADNRHLNPLGGVHGGFAATVLDSATGLAIHSTLDPGVGYGTVDLTLKMLRPVPRDEDLVAEGWVIHGARSFAVSEARLSTAEGRLLATAVATCFLKRP